MKYPRTFHLPFSKGITSDDKIIQNLDFLKNSEVVVTLKMDGENTTMREDKIYARSEDSMDDPSRHWVKNLYYSLNYKLNGRILCGENLYAEHSIHYKNLKSYFYLFGVWDSNYEWCFDWDVVESTAKELSLELVPILYRGKFDLDILRELSKIKSYEGNEVEGFVVRTIKGFPRSDFCLCVAKFVRENHVKTDSHWKYSKIIKNEIRRD